MSEKEFTDVILHGEAASVVLVIPFEVDASEFVAILIFSDGVMLLENVVEVKGVAFTNIFDAKVINDEEKHDGTPLVAPEARSSKILVLTVLVEALGEEVVGKLARLREAINAFSDFEVNPTFMHKLGEIVFANEFFRDIGKTEARIFETIKRGAQGKVRNVEGSKLCTPAE